MSTEKTRALAPISWEVSADKKYLLVEKTRHQVYRRSSVGDYSIVELKPSGKSGSKTFDLKPSHVHPSKLKNGKFMIKLVKWAPVGNAIAYVGADNNIYVRKSVTGNDEHITTDGDPNKVYNGVPDWVFEEEVFEDNSALWWSPDATKIVWGSFDDGNVDMYFLPFYGNWVNVMQYPTIKELRFPKVNTTNPRSSLWVADLSNDIIGSFHKWQVHPPSGFGNQETHFTWVEWANKESFAVNWMNRPQNKTIVSLCPHAGGDCDEIFHYSQTKGWIYYKYRLTFNPNPPNPKQADFVTILPAPHIKHHYR